ncbi:hypothetical protein AURDEDRAFT_174781, partial [Auricularia subglabra TFB-10046 SS5]
MVASKKSKGSTNAKTSAKPLTSPDGQLGPAAADGSADHPDRTQQRIGLRGRFECAERIEDWRCVGQETHAPRPERADAHVRGVQEQLRGYHAVDSLESCERTGNSLCAVLDTWPQHTAAGTTPGTRTPEGERDAATHLVAVAPPMNDEISRRPIKVDINRAVHALWHAAIMSASDMKEQKPDVSSSQEAPQDLGSQETPLKRTDGKIQVTIAFHDQKTKLLMNPTTQFSKVFAKFYAATNAQAG